MGLDREQVLNALSGVKEPATGRSLADLKLVTDVAIEGTTVRLNVDSLSPINTHKDKLERDIRAALGTVGGVGDVIIEMRPDWNQNGIHAAMSKAQERPQTFTFAELARAFVVIAADPNTRTPALLAFDGPHWASATDHRSRRQRETDELFDRAMDRARVVEREAEQLRRLCGQEGVHTAALAVDPHHWQLLRFRCLAIEVHKVESARWFSPRLPLQS